MAAVRYTDCTWIPRLTKHPKGNNDIVKAPSAIGKTQGICIAALQIIDTDIKTCQALMLTSSFDAVQQIQKFTRDIGKFMEIDSPASVGRSDVGDDISALHTGQQFVVGTPDRVLELIQLDAIKIDCLKLFVLDEAHRLVSCGFTRQIFDIHITSSAQVVYLSVTMPHDVMEPATSLMLRDVLHIVGKPNGRPLEGVKQFSIAVREEKQKIEVLVDFCKTFGARSQIIVFCNLRRTLEKLAGDLTGHGITISPMHGDMPAYERAAIMEGFRSGSTRTLLATNLLARGIDVPTLSLVVNYDLPDKHQDYVHRTSSDCSAEARGITINLITAADSSTARDIERYYHVSIEEATILSLAKYQLSAT
jgi:translation initiation factor 4A